MFAQEGAWWKIILVLNKVRDEVLEAKVKATNTDSTLEWKDCEECEELSLEFEGFDSSLDTW